MAARRAWICLGAVGLLAACSEPPAREPLGLHMHRLNTTEYANSLAAVLGVESQVARSLPADAPSHGFDNIADVLTTSPLLVEFQAQAIDEALELALTPEGPLRIEVATCSAEHDDDHCASTIVERLTARAWRRPPSSTELARLLAVSDEARSLGLELDESIAAALLAVLSSPHFLFRIEATSAPGSNERLDPWELAARLSYFLWSAPPDDALLAQARSGALLDPAVLESEARRMLADPRAEALADNFAAQWLGFRHLDDVFKDTARFPAFTPTLRASMAEEPRLSFLDLLGRDGDLRELLTRDDSFVDSHLAALYGLELPDPQQSEPGFVRVDLSSRPRRGLLTQAGLLSTLAYPFTTSPARRGAWVLDNLLCAPIAAPPPGVDVPIDLDAAGKREQLEAHRANPACASCHASIDPIGLAFEGYDAIGGYIGAEDTVGRLPSGVGFTDPIELATAIAEDPAFVPCVVQQTMIYALGRGLGEREHAEVDMLAAELVERGHGLQELFVLVATSEVFRTRIEESAEP